MINFVTFKNITFRYCISYLIFKVLIDVVTKTELKMLANNKYKIHCTYMNKNFGNIRILLSPK